MSNQALFSSAQCQDKGNRHESNPMKFRMNTRIECFVVGVVKHKNRLPRKAVKPPNMEIFQSWLDTILDNWLYLMLLQQCGWTKIIWRDPLLKIPVTAVLQPWELSCQVSVIPMIVQHCDCPQVSNLASNFIALHASRLLVCFGATSLNSLLKIRITSI